MTAIVVGKSKPVRSASLFLLVCGLCLLPAFATPQKPTHPTTQTFPASCYFFASERQNDSARKEETKTERNYSKSIAEVYRHWCEPNASSTQAKLKAADAMAASWKLLWDDDEQYDTIFHEYGAIELLALMGITHQLPAPMVDDLKFTQMWIEECNDTCFTISSDLAKPVGQHYIIMQLRLRNDVLDNLKKESASEPVIQMLWDARYRLVD